ncbi:MAG TPA: cytochrome c oxidase assembly protein [Methylomirabilota bacterium]|jgi:putative copper resistance protein D|nr:cytochrome c oxidase assembly protein [Methylomirabilota bacterium]
MLREPDPGTLLSTWSGDPLPWIGIALATLTYLAGVWMVDRAHPATRVPRWRIAAWLAGVAVIGVALVSAVDVYAESLFTVHMVQHLVLAMVAPPLLAFGAPVTLLLRAATPGLRRSVLIPLLHSRPVAGLAWPPVGWAVFTVVMSATHFSPLFNAALDNEALHSAEHLLYLGAGILFWWPVIGADPVRWRLRPISRMVYLAAQMPFNTAVGLAIYFAPGVLYPHYASVGRAWGPDPLTDQQLAGIVMWGLGDVILLGALVVAIEAWLRADEKRSSRTRERAANVDRASVEGH